MSTAAPRFHRLSVRDVKRETQDAVSIAFAVPDDLAADYHFAPGQYLTLRATIEGEDTRRSYSICSGPLDGELRIAVKQVDNGLFSTWINGNITIGDAVDVMTPTGRFGLERDPGDGRVHVGFAAGSGITPILSIIRGVLQREKASRFFLFYGNRSTDDILFRTSLEEMKDRFLGRLAIFHVLSREEQDLPILNGRLDGEKARLLLAQHRSGSDGRSCLHLRPGRDERGSGSDAEGDRHCRGRHPCRALRLGARRPASAQTHHVESSAPPAHLGAMIVDGKRREIPIAAGEAILDAALRAGMDLPFACKGGMCSTCRAKLVEGEAQMTVNYSLEPWELKAGFILTCQAHPTSPRVVVDFDQV